MAASIKIRAKASGGATTVKTLVNHPMETGLRKDKKGGMIPAHFIQELVAEHGGKTVMTAQWGTGISKNPYMSFKFAGGNKGDKIKISWVDNKGQSDSKEVTIK
jgi:sulfur-oxidizing protein SoxZ